MLYFLYGADREQTKKRANEIALKEKGERRTLTDLHTVNDIRLAYSDGLFAQRKIVVFDGVFAKQELADEVLLSLDVLKKSKEIFIIREEKLDAATKKNIEKYAEKTEVFDLKKEKEETTVFALANALQKRDKKALWVGLQREFAKGNAPEAVHGVLFWGAKQEFQRRDSKDIRLIIGRLVELPHEARRKGIELEYALEHFALTMA